MNDPQVLSLSQLNHRVGYLVTSNPGLQNVWVVAETSDLRVQGGHCYMELIEKDEQTGRPLAKARATIWASTYYRIAARFMAETGQQLRSDLKVMVLVTVNYHPVYGMSLNISDINAAYTLGDVQRRRNEMIRRLQQEGIINDNRSLAMPRVPQRIAIISARGAAGYGDFINQLYNNNSRLRFKTKLFTAALQGERTAPSIIDALTEIGQNAEEWDCVVIIRGGGATADLLWFDNYDLAANIAMFPIPVVIGIGHERDITLLDYVAHKRVKTPTAAAEWLIQCGEQALAELHACASSILRVVSDRIGGCHQQLAFYAGQLPAASINALTKAKNRIANARILIASVTDRRLRPEHVKLDNYVVSIKRALDVVVERERSRLDSKEQLVNVLSPMATLKRGYSITRVGGRAVSSVTSIEPYAEIETVLADGTILSKVENTTKQ